MLPPPYLGLYRRAFLSPTFFVGIGRWGTRVCGKFLNEFEASYALKLQPDGPADGPRSARECFAKLAWVRDMDANLPSVQWATEVRTWPADVDEYSEPGFSDVHGTHSTEAFWRVPLARFRAHLPTQLEQAAPFMRNLLSSVSTTTWHDGARALGFVPASNLALCFRWVVCVGSLFEPETALIAAELPSFITQTVLRGDEGRCRFLFLLDAGIPDNPECDGQPWANCPDSIVAQFLASLEHIRDVGAGSAAFLSTSTSVIGLDAPERDREAAAVGILKAYFSSTLLEPRANAPAEWQTLSLASQSAAVTPARTAVFVELALNLENLPRLIAQDLLASWRRSSYSEKFRLVSAAELAGCLRTWLSSLNGEGPADFLAASLQQWAHEGLHPEQHAQLEAFGATVEDTKQTLLAQIEAAATSTNVPSSKSGGFWNWLRGLFGKNPEVANAATPPTNILNERVCRCDSLLTYLERLRELLDEVARPQSDFQDRTFDTHLESKEIRHGFLLLSYRRLPLRDSCPEAVRRYLSFAEGKVPDAILASWTAVGVDRSVLDCLLSHLESEWKNRDGGERNADERWKQLGFVQWMRTDSALAAAVARYGYSRLRALWQPYAGRQENWKGFLTVFDYGVGARMNQVSPTEEAMTAFSRAWHEVHVSECGHQLGVSSLPPDPELIQYERWPALLGLGLLWTDYPVDGHGFIDDWYSQRLREQASAWQREHPTEAEWLKTFASKQEGRHGETL